MKKLVALVLAAALGISTLLTGCGSSNNSTSQKSSSTKTSESQTAKQVTLRFSWWGDDTRHQATLNAIKLFEQKYPNIKIKAEYAGWDGYLDKQTTQIAGGTAADIMQIGSNWLNIFSKDGNGFYDLNKLSNELKLKENFTNDILKLGTVNGKLNGIPVAMTGPVAYYNKTIYDKLGIPIPQTWDDLFNAAKKFPKGSYPVAFQSANMNVLIAYAEQMTGKTFIDDNGKLGFDENDIKTALEFYKKLLDSKVTPSIQELTNEGGQNGSLEQLPSFLQGKLAGLFQWTTGIQKQAAPLKEKNMEVVCGGLPIPKDAKISGVIVKPSMLFAINKDCKNPKEAATFLNFLLNDPEGVKALGTSRGVPVSKSAEDTLKKEGLISGLEYDGLQFLLNHPTVPYSPYIEDPKLQDLYKEVLTKISYNMFSPDEAAKYMYDNIQKILSEITK
ncbi:sugar ABC transporter substrate-binding protein [Thermoanaerobacterium thermosaccharolyticum]|uniref:ABC transporter substrate-binding protein n=1 Tax=Thermoanaerobacterium thermosaccharolyticum TaxID=1517 RepID=UPI003D27C7DA